MTMWFLVPARGGSKGIPFKNVRPLAGKPLVRHVIDRILASVPDARVILSSDSAEILEQAPAGVICHKRSTATATDKATIDDVAQEAARWLVEKQGADPSDALFTVQPTSPLLSEKTLLAAVAMLKPHVDTVLSLTEERKLTWSVDETNRMKPNYHKRVNRQELRPFYRETGAIVGCRLSTILKTGTRFGARVEPIIVDAQESIDIDTYEDWLAVEYVLGKKRIAIRCDGSRGMGFGHLYRGVALCQSFAGNTIKVFARVDGDYSIGYDFLQKYPFDITPLSSSDEFFDHLQAFQPDIVINDVLDTAAGDIERLKSMGFFVVNFEDTGSGARVAHLVVNDLYPPLLPDKHVWSGVQYSVLHPQFESVKPESVYPSEVTNLLIVFGGTDEGNLTLKAIDAVVQSGYRGSITVVVGPGNKHLDEIMKRTTELQSHCRIETLVNVQSMAKLMQKMQFAVSSAGRTLTELMTLGVPTMALCQNVRELRHSHASIGHGVINLSLGSYLSSESLAQHLKAVLGNHDLRAEMRMRMLQSTEGRRNAAIIQAILEQFDQWRGGQSD
jgi:CMP-N-acetylneuraminic acid synthetase/spore coat polysaccharide biosynthesis predicted glycosyltransferase SpsG